MSATSQRLSMLLGVCLSGTAIGCAEEASPTDPLGRALLPTRFGFPVRDPDLISTRIGVDHDPVVHQGVAANAICKDYLDRPFPNCYDEHHGTDFILDGGFEAMDAGSVEVVAGYDGWVVEVVDGNYDRCRNDLGTITCDGYPIEANYITIAHPDGVTSKYYHLQTNSVLVEVGEKVRCGDPIARIGSSGFSSFPHLHFEVEIEDEWIDPYAGPRSQSWSLWETQGGEFDWPEAGCTAR